jgi:hypothetical protein
VPVAGVRYRRKVWPEVVQVEHHKEDDAKGVGSCRKEEEDEEYPEDCVRDFVLRQQVVVYPYADKEQRVVDHRIQDDGQRARQEKPGEEKPE